jgi:hypothetical protein
MLLKWIVCEVPGGRRLAFSQAQEQWRSIATLDGFWGQLGGWSVHDPAHACIAGFWRDQIALERFMQQEHDSIVQRSKQSQTYASIQVSIFDVDAVAAPLATITKVRASRQMVEFLNDDRLVLRVALHAASLDADTVLIEPAWTIEPKG